jgi:hypothetical protein
VCAFIAFAAEAIAATLYIVGFPEFAKQVLLPFNWGPEFFRVNGELLDMYAAAPSSQAVVAVQVRLPCCSSPSVMTRSRDWALTPCPPTLQARWMERLEHEIAARRLRQRDLPPTSDSSSGSDAEDSGGGQSSSVSVAPEAAASGADSGIVGKVHSAAPPPGPTCVAAEAPPAEV